MRGKFVWADGYLKTGEGFENSKERPLHHRYLIEALVNEGKIEWPAKNCLCGWYGFDPFDPERITGREGAKWGVTPTLEECLQMIKEQQPKVAKYDYAATMEYLAAEYTEAEGEEILRIIRETGGGTFIKKATNSYDPLYVGRGYYVSEEGKEQKLPLAMASPDTVLNYANSTIPTGEMLGTWVDGSDLYLDCSRWHDDYDQAIEFGKANHQIAIWDAGNEQEIRLDGTVTSDGALPVKWAWIQNWLDENEVVAKTSSANFYKLYDDPDVDGEDLNDLWLKYFWDDQTQTLYYWRTLGIDGDPIHYDGFREFSRQTGEEITYGQADQFSDRFAWGLEASDAFGDSLSFEDSLRGSTFFIYDTHGDSSVKARALEAVRELVNSEHIAATSEDTEPVGKQVGFIQDPHEELYPCLFRGEDSIPSDVIETLKNHVLEPLSERFEEPDSWIMFSIYGSGISYNWDESGDMDIQMWVDINEFLRYNFDEDMDQDELLSEVRMIVQQRNFPSFKDLGLTYEDCAGEMLIQYYPKPGTGSKEENLASKPYACYDMDTGTWLQKPIVLKPKFYGETFLMLMPKAEEIAKQAEALLADYKRDILNWEFWDLLYRKNKKKEFKEQLDATISDAEDRKEGIKTMFQGIFGGRAEAYSPGGRGVKDERDIMQKLLEVWGTFQDLKHYAREPLPWEIEVPAEPKESRVEHWVRLANFHIVAADVYELAQNAWKNLAEQQFAPYIIKLDLDNMEDEKMKRDIQGISREFMLVMTDLLTKNPETFKFFPWLWREYKSAMQKVLNGTMDDQTIMAQNRNHIVDILKQATALMEKIRTDPRPESKVPNVMADFKPGPDGDGFRQLEAWTYENGTKYQQESLAKDEPVFDLGQNWKIVRVSPENLGWEGEQMGHCVGGYCDVVERGDSIIYSLRDPKGMPHATIEIEGKFAGGMKDVDGQTWNATEPVDPLTPTDENDAWQVVQIQGKENADPKPEYKAMIREWFTTLRQNGINVKWAGSQWNDNSHEIYIGGDGDFTDWLGRGDPLPQQGDLDEYGLPKVIDFTFNIDHTIETVAVALVQSDAHSFDNLLQSEYSVQQILNGFMELVNYQKELWPQSADRVDQEIEKGIEAAYNWYNKQWDEMRDQNFDYIWETMKGIWEYEYPGESWEDAWENEDPRVYDVQERAEKYLDNEMTAPYRDGLNFLKGLQAAIGTGEPITASVKLAIWSDIVEKATRYLNEGRVQMQNNMPDHSIATVRGDTGDWTTEIWRQDPSRPNTLSGWSCTCPWGEHSWGRTRIWKKYEGRPCAHTVVLSWESQRQPWDVDEQGNEQLELFDAQQQPGRSFDQYTQDIPRATPPNPNSPNLQLIEQLQIPGTFSSWKKESTEIVDLPEGLETHGWDDIRRTLVYVPTIDKMWLAPDNVYHTEIYQWIYQNEPEVYSELYDLPNSHGIVEGNVLWAIDEDFPENVVSALEAHLKRPLIQKGWVMPRGINDDWYGDEDYNESQFGEQPWWSWQRTTAFLNGGFVRNKVKMIGTDDRGESYMVPRNTVGEVLYSDDSDTIVIFNLESGPLGAHLIRVEETTDKFMAAPKNILDRGPAPRRRAPNA